MPRVSTYGGPQVATRPLGADYKRDVRTPESFGAGLGRQMAGIGLEAIEATLAAERQKADELALLEADTQLSSWENQRLYDPQAGALTIKGKDSFGLPEEVLGELDKTGNEILAGLTTDRQKIAFQRALQNRRQAVDLTLRRHVFQEMGRFDVEQTEAYLQNATSAAIQNAGDPRRVVEELTRGVGAISKHAARNGVSADVAARQIEQFRTGVHAGVIDRMLTAGADTAARVYFDEAKEEIAGEAIARIEAALEEGTLRGQAQRQSDAILADAANQTEALERARAIEDPKLRDAVEDRVVRGFQLRKQAEAERDEQTMTAAVNLLEQSAGDVAAIPPTVWSSMSIQQRSALRSYGKAIAPGGPGDVETDLGTYYALIQQADGDPGKFGAVNLMNYVHKLGKTEFKELAGLQSRVRKGGSVEAELDDYRTENQVITEALAVFGVDTSENPAAVARLRRMVADQTRATQRLTGKKATNADVQAIVDDMLSQRAEITGSFWGLFGQGRFADQSKRLVDVNIGDVPARDRQQIEDALRQMRRPVNDETVLQLFIDTQLRMSRGAR